MLKCFQLYIKVCSVIKLKLYVIAPKSAKKMEAIPFRGKVATLLKMDHAFFQPFI